MEARPAPTGNAPAAARVAASAVTLWREHSGAVLATLGMALLWLGYVIVFSVAESVPRSEAITDATINTVPAAGLAIVVGAIMDRLALRRPWWMHLAVHLPVCIAFTYGWYLLILVGHGIKDGWLEGFAVRPFVFIAFVWQMFQGVTLYAVIVLLIYTLHYRAETARLRTVLRDALAAREATAPPAALHGGEAQARSTADTILVRRDDEIVSLALSDIVRITGAGDYAEIVTQKARYLSLTTLTAFAERLPDSQFLRIHRSHIVRLGAVSSAEPAGNGRLTLHLSDGESVTASRAGSRAFKAAAV